jgi:cation-transporting ATPase E
MQGLTQQEVVARRQRGEGNETAQGTGRTILDIVRANLFTFFNNLLFAIGVLLVVLGQTGDALTSVGLGVLNALISTFQEIRAKRQLDKIALLTRPEVTVVRDSTEQVIDPAELVKGDMVRVQAGDQIVVDGIMQGEGFLEMDESLLTGEADLIRKQAGDTLYSASFCVTGDGYFEADKVGADSFANQLTSTARNFHLSVTPLQQDINLVVRVLMLMVAIMGIVFGITAILESFSFLRTVQIAAVLTGLVPYGLFLMVVVSYALGAVKIGNEGALVQQTNAIESLSNIDVLCMDKTGTLTANRLQFHDLFPLNLPKEDVTNMLGVFVNSSQAGNKTSEAINAGILLTNTTIPPTLDEIPFASARKWSAIANNAGTFVMGAVEMLQPYLTEIPSAMTNQIQTWSDNGLRVLLFAYNPNTTTLHNPNGDIALPNLTPIGVVSLSDELRPQAKETIAQFANLGIDLKIISGDNPHTVSALAKQAGLPATKLISGTALAEMTPAQFDQAATEFNIFGRISPDQKEKLVDALIRQGKYVAMMGDGVNDVLSLKKAKIGIAMQSGSNATRNVADMVLLNDSFAALSPAFTEGKRIINGMVGILFLFLVRVITSALIIIGITMIGLAFPFEPSQGSLTLFTVGIPTLFFTMWARPELSKENLLRSLVRFVLPASLLTMLIGVTLYTVNYTLVVNRFTEFSIPRGVVEQYENMTGIAFDMSDEFSSGTAVIVAQSILSMFISYTAMLLILFLEPPHKFFTGWKKVSPDKRYMWLTIGLIALFSLFISTPTLANTFGLLAAGPPMYVSMAIGIPIWFFSLRAIWRARSFERFLGMDG